VVLRGAGRDASGNQKSKIFFTRAAESGIHIGGSLNDVSNSNWDITVEADVFDTSVTVQDATGISVGDDILISWDITADFKAEHNSSNYWYHVSVGEQRDFFRRTVTAISGNKISFKVPLR
jgi:hypothetical protein